MQKLRSPNGIYPGTSNDVPYILSRVAELSACYAGTEAKIADADGIVLEGVCKIVPTFSHCTNKYADTLLRSKIRDIVGHPYYFSVMAQSDFAAIGREMISDGIFYDFEQLFLGVGGADTKPV